MTNSNDSQTAIMRRLSELGTPFQFQSATNNVWTADECFLGPDDLESATATLVEEFGIETLCSCGVLQQPVPPESAEASPRISVEFGSAAGPMIALTRGKPATVRLMTNLSAASHQPLPLVRALSDVTTFLQLTQRRGILLLTASVGAAAVLRTLGLPSTPAGPLQNLNRTQLKKLAALFWNTRRLLTKHGSVELTLVLADWQPDASAAEGTAGVYDLAQFLGRVNRRLQINLGDVALWHPSAAEREEIEFVIRSGDKASLWSAVSSSLDASCYAVEGFDEAMFERRERPADWRDALQRVLKESELNVQHGVVTPESIECAKIFSELVERDLVKPIHDHAANTTDPLQKVLLALAAETSRSLQLQLPQVHRLLSVMATGPNHQAYEELAKELAQRNREINVLLKLTKTIRK